MELTENVTEVVRSGSLAVAFVLLCVLGDRNTWMTADILAAVSTGLALIFCPQFFLQMLSAGAEVAKEQLDVTHITLARVLGIMLVCSALMWWQTRETRDGTVPITLCTSRVFSYSVILLSQVYVLWGVPRGEESPHIAHQHIYFSTYGAVLMLLGNFVNLVRSTDFSTYPQHNIRINTHLRVDAWLMMLHGLIAFGFPDFLITAIFHDVKPNTLSRHLVRLVATQAFGSAVISMQAPGFLHEKDKRSQFFSRMVNTLAMWGMLTFCYAWAGVFDRDVIFHHVVASLPLFINSAIGYFADGTTIYSPRKKRE